MVSGGAHRTSPGRPFARAPSSLSPRRTAPMPLPRPDLPRPRGLLAASAGTALVAGMLVSAPALADGETPERLGTAAELGVEVPTADELRAAGETTVPGRWLVEVEGQPTLRGGSKASATAAQETVAERAEDAAIPLEVQESFTTGWNGMSVEMDDADAQKLSEVEGVRAVYPVLEVAAPEPADATPSDVYGNAMTGVDQVQQVDGLSGEGVTVAVI